MFYRYGNNVSTKMVLKHVLSEKLMLDHSTLVMKLFKLIGLTTWILSDNVSKKLTLICLVSQLLIEPPNSSQNLLHIVFHMSLL